MYLVRRSPEGYADASGVWIRHRRAKNVFFAGLTKVISWVAITTTVHSSLLDPESRFISPRTAPLPLRNNSMKLVSKFWKRYASDLFILLSHFRAVQNHWFPVAQYRNVIQKYVSRLYELGCYRWNTKQFTIESKIRKVDRPGQRPSVSA